MTDNDCVGVVMSGIAAWLEAESQLCMSVPGWQSLTASDVFGMLYGLASSSEQRALVPVAKALASLRQDGRPASEQYALAIIGRLVRQVEDTRYAVEMMDARMKAWQSAPDGQRAIRAADVYAFIGEVRKAVAWQ